MGEGSSATGNVRDVTDVTDVIEVRNQESGIKKMQSNQWFQQFKRSRVTPTVAREPQDL
jgi:hypothetical protein